MDLKQRQEKLKQLQKEARELNTSIGVTSVAGGDTQPFELELERVSQEIKSLSS